MKIALHELDADDRLHGQQIKRKDPTRLADSLVRYLTPGAWRSTKINNDDSRPDQFVLVVDLHQFVGSPGTPTL